MRIVWTKAAWDDLTSWITTDKATTRRILRLIDDMIRDPFEGIGKPEQLRHTLSGMWSRRIDEKHRLVYRVIDDDIIIIQARDHY